MLAKPIRISQWPLVPALLAVTALGGCQAPAPLPPALTTQEIVEWSKSGKPPGEIIARIHESRAVYPLRAKEAHDLIEQGVDEGVVDEMLQTRVRQMEAFYRDLYSPPVHAHFYWSAWDHPFWWHRRCWP
jgi:hypothetical protein